MEAPTPFTETKHPRDIEAVGNYFTEYELEYARKRTWEAVAAIARQISPGMTETDAKLIALRTLEAMGCEKNWHPPQVRFGVNTTKGFGIASEPNVVLAENDLFFLDIGPVFG